MNIFDFGIAWWIGGILLVIILIITVLIQLDLFLDFWRFIKKR